MTTDTAISAALILIVIRQIKEHKLDLHTLLIPCVLVGIAAHHYLQHLTIGGNDPLLIGLLASVGAAVGLASGRATHLRRGEDGVYARAGVTAAGLWIASMGARAAFVFAVGHGFGDDVARFSAQHDITSQGAWALALIGMAVLEVTVRMSTIALRAQRLGGLGELRPAHA